MRRPPAAALAQPHPSTGVVVARRHFRAKRTAPHGKPSGGLRYRHLLICIKQTPYEALTRLKAQGQAPPAVRWERLRDRNEKHQEAVRSLESMLRRLGYQRNAAAAGPVPSFRTVLREEMHSAILQDVDLVVSVGGDGTVLSTAHFLNREHRTDGITLIGINSDPSAPDDVELVKKNTDERRSRGALCALRSDNMSARLPLVLMGHCEPSRRTRMQACIVSTHSRSMLAPALNDVLIAHPNPAAVSRFRLEVAEGDGTHGAFQPGAFSAWSSGVWVATATGSTAAIKSAGGQVLPTDDTRLQYAIREHLLEHGFEHLADRTVGMIPPGHTFHIRWNTQGGRIFVDGHHLYQDVALGDEIFVNSQASPLLLFDRAPEPAPCGSPEAVCSPGAQ